MENYTIIPLASSFKVTVLMTVWRPLSGKCRGEGFLFMFGFTDVAIRGYHSAERKLYVWLQPDKITFIH